MRAMKQILQQKQAEGGPTICKGRGKKLQGNRKKHE